MKYISIYTLLVCTTLNVWAQTDPPSLLQPEIVAYDATSPTIRFNYRNDDPDAVSFRLYGDLSVANSCGDYEYIAGGLAGSSTGSYIDFNIENMATQKNDFNLSSLDDEGSEGLTSTNWVPQRPCDCYDMEDINSSIDNFYSLSGLQSVATGAFDLLYAFTGPGDDINNSYFVWDYPTGWEMEIYRGRMIELEAPSGAESGYVKVKIINPCTGEESQQLSLPVLVDDVLIDQTITWEQTLVEPFVGDDAFDLSATASSNLEVSFSSSNTDVATISGTTVTIIGAGTTTISANQAGDDYHIAAPVVEKVLTVISQAANPANFITTWKTDNIGSSEDNQITIPVKSGLTYDYTVYWGDGFVDENVTGTITHTYAEAGSYAVAISGNFPAIYFNNAGDKEKLLTIDNWGEIAWESMVSAFRGCSNMTLTATDDPDLSGVTEMIRTFELASSFDGDLSSWVVTTVTNMNYLFKDASSFNGNISTWNVSNVEEMGSMFRSATSFNSDISEWTLTQLIDAGGMFWGASSFNQDISEWNTSSVESMGYMFKEAASFNADIGSWQTGNVLGTYGMFDGATSFNHNLNWDMSKVTLAKEMFQNTTAFNGNMPDWNLGSATDVSRMFKGATNFNGDINGWTLATDAYVYEMFSGATSFNQDLDEWDVSGLTSTNHMFAGATAFNGNISTWNVENVQYMDHMFNDATSFNNNINTWNVSNVTGFSHMFEDATSFNQDLNNWDLSSASDMTYMFENASNFNGNIDGWIINSSVQLNYIFYEASSFNQDLNNWDVSAVTTMRQWFNYATAFDGNIGEWDVSNVENMSSMFDGATSFNGEIKEWDVSKVESMSDMFYKASSFNQDISEWDISMVGSMSRMFEEATSFSTINYDKLLIAWSSLETVPTGISLGAEGLYFCSGEAARQLLIDDYEWTISDEGALCLIEQLIIFNPLETKTFGDETFDLSSTGGESGNPVTYTSSNLEVATIEDHTITIIGAGETTITASQDGNEEYYRADDVEQTLIINKADQTISFEAIAGKTFGDEPFELSGSSSSALAVSYSSSDESVATVVGTTVTIIGIGEVTITASQSGNENYHPAEDVEQSFEVVIIKESQTITFNALPEKTFGDENFNLEASASSGLTITYSSSDETVATIIGSEVTIVGVGTTTITASQAGNENYHPAEDVERVLEVVDNRESQTIIFNALSEKTFGDENFNLEAAASSGLAITYSSSDETVATILGNEVTIIGAGTTTITASQLGNENFSAAPSVDQEFTVNKADQTITFESLVDKSIGDDDFELVATASSGLMISYVSSNEAVATISGSMVTIVGTGTTSITANQTGNGNFNAASSISQGFAVVADIIQGIDEELVSWKIYPNPTVDFINIETPSHLAFEWQIVSFSGSNIQKGFSTSKNTKIETGKLPSGVYLIVLKTADSASQTLKFLK